MEAESHKIAQRQAAFLAAFGQSGNIIAAAQAAQIHQLTHYDWLDNDAAGTPSRHR